MRKLKGMAEELDQKKQQTDQLLFEFVPSVVADSFRLGKPAPPREFLVKVVNHGSKPFQPHQPFHKKKKKTPSNH